MNEDLKPYLNNHLHVRLADWLYRSFFQPVLDLVDRLQRRWTAKWVESNIPKKERVQ